MNPLAFCVLFLSFPLSANFIPLSIRNAINLDAIY